MTLSQAFLVSRRLREVALSRSMTIPLKPVLLPSEMSVFGFLARKGAPALVSEIVSATGLAQSRVSNVAKRLQKRGWVEITTPPEDGRTTSVKIVDAILGQMQAFLGRTDDAIIDLLTAGLTAERKASVALGLGILAEHLEQQSTSQKPKNQ